MATKTYYIENSERLNEVLELLKMAIPCIIEREYIEMNFSQIEIIARAEDLRTVEKYLAPLM